MTKGPHILSACFIVYKILHICGRHDESLVDFVGNRRMLLSRKNGITITTEVFHFTFFCEVYFSAAWCIVLYRQASFRTQWYFIVHCAHGLEFWLTFKIRFKYHARTQDRGGYAARGCTEVALVPWLALKWCNAASSVLVYNSTAFVWEL